jgi:hypothetical protein
MGCGGGPTSCIGSPQSGGNFLSRCCNLPVRIVPYGIALACRTEPEQNEINERVLKVKNF